MPSSLCLLASNKFNYDEGTTYEFQYQNEIRTSVNGASEDYAGHEFLAKVHMDFLTKCEINMRVRFFKTLYTMIMQDINNTFLVRTLFKQYCTVL